MLAVANCMENAHKDVVQHCKNGTAEIEPEVGHRLGHNTFRGVHPPENRGGENHAQHRQNAAGHQTESYICMDGDAHLSVIAGTVEPGNDHTGTHGDTVEESHKHKNQAAGGADCSQSGIADEFAHHPGVEGVVKLLKDIAQKNRQGEKEHLVPDGAFRQGIRVGMQEKHFLYK